MRLDRSSRIKLVSEIFIWLRWWLLLLLLFNPITLTIISLRHHIEVGTLHIDSLILRILAALEWVCPRLLAFKPANIV